MKKIFITIIYLLSCSILFSATVKKWEFNNYEKFKNGEFNNVSLTENGQLMLSPEIEKITGIDCMYVWDIKSDSKGNIYIATGNEGIIYKIDKDKKITKFFETASIAAFKILIDKDDNLYVSTLTKGIIYKIRPNGEGEVFYIFKGDHIWDMIFDDDGNIIMATGVPGVLYKLDVKTKNIQEICSTTEMHITSLVKNGDFIYFGTADNGTLYKYSIKNKKLEVIFQPKESIIHSIIIRKSDNVIFIGTAEKDFREQIKTSDSFKVLEPVKEIRSDTKEVSKIQLPYNSVYKIIPNGYVKKIIELKETTFLSFEFDKNENLYIGTGDKGIIYRCSKNDRVEKIVENDSMQVLKLYFFNDEMFYGTGNPGGLYVIKKEYPDEGYYISEILNSGGWSKWGKIFLNLISGNGTSINIMTRSGNSENIDESWSKWEPVYTNFNELSILSPPAQYLQYKIIFKTSNKKFTPVVSNIEIFYSLNNRPPEIKSFEIIRDKKEEQKDKKSIDSSSGNVKNYELKFKWNASDLDDDTLTYKIMLKNENLNKWQTLKEDFESNEFTIDTRKLPDDKYFFKIIATDIKSNPAGNQLETESEIGPVIIDNTPPQIEVNYNYLGNNRYKISGKVIDNLSRIFAILYSIDTKEWNNVFPKDLIFDSKIEEFEFEIKCEKRPAIIAVMVQDEYNNVNTRYLVIK